MTKTFALAFTAAAALLISAGAVAADAPTSPPMPTIVGGWSALAPGNTELRAVARFVVPRLGRRHARLQRIESGERQVVAGTN